MSSSYANNAKHNDEVNAATAKIESSDPSIVIQGLNTLTKKSFEALESHSIHLENYPQLAISIGSLLDIVNPLTAYIFSCENGNINAEDVLGQWTVKLPCEGNPHIRALAYCLDDNTLLLSTLNILRNLSFDIVNEQIMGASAPFLQHLVAMLVLSIESGSSMQATHLAVEILINIGSKIDFTGKKRLQGFYFTEDTSRLKASTDVLQRNLLQLRVNRHMSTASSQEYLSAVSALMSAITTILSGNSFPDRSLTLRTVDLLGRLAGNADNAHFISRSPDVLFQSLAQLLCTSTTFAEPLVSDLHHVNGDPLGRRRPPAAVTLSNKLAAVSTTNNNSSSANLSGASTIGGSMPITENPVSNMNITFGGVKLDSASSVYPSGSNLDSLGGPSSSSMNQRPVGPGSTGIVAQASFFNEYSDMEVRDQVLEALHALCLLGPSVQLRLVQVPRLVEILLRIATSSSAAGPLGGSSATGGGGAGAVVGVGGGGVGSSGFSSAGVSTAPRSEGVIKSLQILASLLALPEASQVFLSLQSEFLAAACSDDFIAEVVCNKALPVQQDLRARLAYSSQQQQLEQQFAAETQQAMQY